MGYGVYVVAAYSSNGIAYKKYNNVKDLRLSKTILFFSILSFDNAFAIIISTLLFQLPYFEKLSPGCLWESTSWMGFPFMYVGG